MLRRRLGLLIVTVSAVGLAATGCAEQSAAIRVDDLTVARSDFEDMLDSVYENDEARMLLFRAEIPQEQIRNDDDPQGSYPQEYVSAIAGFEVERLLLEKMVDDEGDASADALAETRDQIQAEIDESGGFSLDDLPASVVDNYLDRQAAITVLVGEMGQDGFQQAAREAVNDATVEVDSRYGTWNADEFTITPPAGPAAPTGSTSADLLAE